MKDETSIVVTPVLHYNIYMNHPDSIKRNFIDCPTAVGIFIPQMKIFRIKYCNFAA